MKSLRNDGMLEYDGTFDVLIGPPQALLPVGLMSGVAVDGPVVRVGVGLGPGPATRLSIDGASGRDGPPVGAPKAWVSTGAGAPTAVRSVGATVVSVVGAGYAPAPVPAIAAACWSAVSGVNGVEAGAVGPMTSPPKPLPP